MTDDAPKPRSFAEKLKAMSLPEGDYLHLPAPASMPDSWTHDAAKMQNEAILTGTCPSCGASIDRDDPMLHPHDQHEPGCPASGLQVEMFCIEHDLDLDGIRGVVYVKRDDGGYDEVGPVP